MARRKRGLSRKNYFIILAVYTLLLICVAAIGLSVVWRYAQEYENARPQNVIEEYVANLRENLWDDSIAETIANMPHEVQSDEECAELVKEMLSSGITYNRSGSSDAGTIVNYELRCNNNPFGVIGLIEDEDMADKVKFGMLPWKIYREEFDFAGLYNTVRVTVPKTYEVYLNDVLLGSEYIVEEGIHYDILDEYYSAYENLPTKVTYQFDNAIGVLEPVIKDESGQIFVIDESKDDSQYIKDCSEEQLAKLGDFSVNFLNKYLVYITGGNDPITAYANLMPYLQLGSDLDERMKIAQDGLGWAHTQTITVNSTTLNGALDLGDGFYMLDMSATTTIFYPGKGEVVNDHNMKVIVIDNGVDIRAISQELY